MKEYGFIQFTGGEYKLTFIAKENQLDAKNFSVLIKECDLPEFLANNKVFFISRTRQFKTVSGFLKAVGNNFGHCLTFKKGK